MTDPVEGREEPRGLFVYGTLRDGMPGPGAPRAILERAAEKVGEGTVPARLLDAGGFPAAIPDPSGRVRGELYELADPARALRVLDRYEGCRRDGSGLFRREIVGVELDSGQEREAWVYFYDREVTGMPEIPSGDYREHLTGE